MRSFENDVLQMVRRVDEHQYGKKAARPDVFNVDHTTEDKYFIIAMRENTNKNYPEYLLQFDDKTGSPRTNKWVDYHCINHNSVMTEKITRFNQLWYDLQVGEDWDYSYFIPSRSIPSNIYRQTQRNTKDYEYAREIIKSWRPTF